MADIKTFPYLCFVRFDLPNKAFDREFNIHFDEHIQELADKPGYSTAWRTQEWRSNPVKFNYNEGALEQEYQQIYAIKDPALFQSFPQNPPPPVPESMPWRRDVGNWGRVFYRVLNLFEKDPRAGRCWARCESNLPGTAAQEAQFQTDNAQHIQRVLALPGIHRAWQLQHAPHACQIGADPAGKFMTMYEADAPENVFDPSLGEERLPLKAGQAFAGRHFAHLLLKAEPQR